MQAAEVGVKIIIDAQFDLSTATALNLRVQGPKDSVPRDLSLTVGIAPTTAERITTTTDFPDNGLYFLQLVATFASPTQILKSPQQLLLVKIAL